MYIHKSVNKSNISLKKRDHLCKKPSINTLKHSSKNNLFFLNRSEFQLSKTNIPQTSISWPVQ